MVEDTRPGGSIPFLDIIITTEQDKILSTGVYKNPHIQTSTYNGTVTIRQLQNSVTDTPTHRVKSVCST